MTRLTASIALIAAFGLVACQPKAEAPAAEAGTPATEVAQSTAVMPADAPPQEEAGLVEAGAPAEEAATCSEGIGQAAASRLVERCIAVSPATHPPCNVSNPCSLIQDEIDRSCAMYGPGETKPSECAA